MEKLSSSIKGNEGPGSSGSRLKNLFKRKAKMIGSVGAALNELQLVPGKLYSWGGNDSGQLGNRGEHPRPSLIDSLRGIIVVDVAMGGKHTALVTEDGSLLCFGSNEYGQLGNGTIEDSIDPIRAGERVDQKFVSVKCGEVHTLALTESGRVYAFGSSNFGQLGQGDTEPQTYPRLIESIEHQKVIEIACGAGHSMALTDSGRLYVWGWGESGQLGLGDLSNQLTPKWLEFLQHANVVHIACGESHSAAVSVDGHIYTWGSGEDGRLGHTPYGVSIFPARVTEKIESVFFVGIACGEAHTLAISDRGGVYSWGNGQEGQLGIGLQRNAYKPSHVEDLASEFVTDAACGYSHSIVVTEKGHVYGWGINDHGQCGISSEDGKDDIISRPRKITFGTSNAKMRKVACGGDSSICVAGGDILLPPNIFACGDNSKGTLGDGTRESRTQLMPMHKFDGIRVKSVSSGMMHTTIVTESKEVWVVGDGESGQLGLGESTQSAVTPVRLQSLASRRVRITEIACGPFHTIALAENGTCFAWGYNRNGELGLNHDRNVFEPEPIDLLQGIFVTKIRCGWDFSIAISDTFDSFVWGGNAFGQLGLGHEKGVLRPTPLAQMSGRPIRDVQCGRAHVLALTMDGDVFSWGANASGQLGIGTTKHHSLPQKISSLRINIVRIACGSSHSCALGEEGECWVWGAGNSGRLGHGDSKDVHEPKPISVFHDIEIKEIWSSCCSFHSFCLTYDHDLYSWGHGLFGQLSLGDSNNVKIPMQVRSLGMLHVCQVSCSFKSSYVVCEPSIRTPIAMTSFGVKRRTPQLFQREKTEGSLKKKESSSLKEDEEAKKVQEKYERMKQRNMELRKEIEELRRQNTHLTATDLTELPPEELDDLRKTFLHGIQKVGETRGSKLRDEMKEREKILLEELEKVYLNILKEYHKKETEIRHDISVEEKEIEEIEEKLSGFRDQWNKVTAAEAWIPQGKEEIRNLEERWEECTLDYERMAQDHHKATKKANDAIRERKRLETRYEMLSDEMSQLEDEIEHLSLRTRREDKDKNIAEKSLPWISDTQIRDMATEELLELEDKYQTALTRLIK